MIIKLAEFKVKKGKLAECEKAIEEFVDKVRESEPDTLLYESFQKGDELTFVHLMKFKDEGAEKYHRETPWVKKFVEVLYPNCSQKPEFYDLKLVATNS